jgi:ribosomal protein S27AE
MVVYEIIKGRMKMKIDMWKCGKCKYLAFDEGESETCCPECGGHCEVVVMVEETELDESKERERVMSEEMKDKLK